MINDDPQRSSRLAQNRAEELELLKRMRREAAPTPTEAMDELMPDEERRPLLGR